MFSNEVMEDGRLQDSDCALIGRWSMMSAQDTVCFVINTRSI